MKSDYLKSGSLLLLMLIMLSCGGKKEEKTTEVADKKEWKEMDEFHLIMAESFHPYMDSSNLEPAKKNADQMAALAEKWFNAALPAKVDHQHVKEKLKALRDGTAEFRALVNAGNDDAIKEHLDDLHNLFHELQEEWYHDHHDHGHDGHDHHNHNH